MNWTDWWLWIAGGLVIAIFEAVIPGYLFVGFAVGAIITGIWLGISLPGAEWMAAGLPNTLVVFAALSLVAWIVLRRSLGVRSGQVKTFDHDINEP